MDKLDFSDDDILETVVGQRQLTADMLGEIKPDAVFIANPWPERALGVILGCSDVCVPTLVKFALVPTRPLKTTGEMAQLLREAMRCRQHWFCNSQFSADLLTASWELPAGSVDSFHVGPIGLVDLVETSASDETREVCRASVREEFGLPPHATIVVSVGRLSEQKGLRYLLDAAPAVVRQTAAETFFLLIGDGEERKDLVDKIASLGLGMRVILAGFRSDVRRMLRASDLFVLPTLFEGGCSQALLEAMDEGLAVVATRVSAIPEVLTHGEDGLLVDAGSGSQLAEAIDHLLTHSSVAERLAAGALRRAKEFSRLAMFENTHRRLRYVAAM